MNKILQNVIAVVTMIFVYSAALGESGKNSGQEPEMKFNIHLTSALNNDPEAQYLVAEMYEQGVGTPRNLRMAHLWYNKSAKQGYAPAVEKLDNWEKARQESESAARERAAEQKRRQAAAEAAAVAKAAREETAAKAARERAEEQKRRQAEAEAAAVAKAARAETTKTTQTTEISPIAKEIQSDRPKDKPKEPMAKNTGKDTGEFRANPCKTPTAKFTSVCQ